MQGDPPPARMYLAALAPGLRASGGNHQDLLDG